MVTWILDISNWQGDFDIAQAAREGYDAIICKATEGTGTPDGWFDTFIPKIRAAGKIPGAYHFLRCGDGAGQAREFHSRVRNHGGPDGWLIGLDCESDGYTREILDWVGEWNRLTGGHPFMFYTGAWWWPRIAGFNGAALTPYLWHSHYVWDAAANTSARGFGSSVYDRVPDGWWSPGYGGWDRVTLLQFTSRAVVAGREVDANAFLGTVDDLRVLTCPGPGAPPANPNPPSEGVTPVTTPFDGIKDMRIGAPPPDWMGGPRDQMRFGDWLGSVPHQLTAIHEAADAAVGAARDAASRDGEIDGEVEQALAKLDEVLAALKTVASVDTNAVVEGLVAGITPVLAPAIAPAIGQAMTTAAGAFADAVRAELADALRLDPDAHQDVSPPDAAAAETAAEAAPAP